MAPGTALLVPARAPVTAGSGGCPRSDPGPAASAPSLLAPAGERRLSRRARRPPQGQDPGPVAAFVAARLPCPGWKRSPHAAVRSRATGHSRAGSRLAPRMAPRRPCPQRPRAAGASAPAGRPGRPRSAPLLHAPRALPVPVCRRLPAPHSPGKPPRARAPSPPAPRLRSPSSLSAAGVGEGGPSLPFPSRRCLRLPCRCPRGRRGGAAMPAALRRGRAQFPAARMGPPPGHDPPQGGGQPLLGGASGQGRPGGLGPVPPPPPRCGYGRCHRRREVSLQPKGRLLKSLAAPHSHRERQRPCGESQRGQCPIDSVSPNRTPPITCPCTAEPDTTVSTDTDCSSSRCPA